MEGDERRPDKVPTLENYLHYTRTRATSDFALPVRGLKIRRSLDQLRQSSAVRGEQSRYARLADPTRRHRQQKEIIR